MTSTGGGGGGGGGGGVFTPHLGVGVRQGDVAAMLCKNKFHHIILGFALDSSTPVKLVFMKLNKECRLIAAYNNNVGLLTMVENVMTKTALLNMRCEELMY